MVESMQLKGDERMEEDRHQAEKALIGTWQHPNPSVIFVSNPRLLWRFIKRFGIVVVLVIAVWFAIRAVIWFS
jgi:hypothetical protein